MRDLKYYEDQQKEIYEAEILKELEKGPVTVTVDCIVENPRDLEKKSVQFSIRSVWRRLGRVEYEKSKFSIQREIVPNDGALLNGIPLEKGTVIPIFAPRGIEDHELTTHHMIEGLMLHLRKGYDDYYHKLLLSFDLSYLPVDIQEDIKGWKDGK